MIPTSNTKKKLLKDMIQMTLHLNKITALIMKKLNTSSTNHQT